MARPKGHTQALAVRVKPFYTSDKDYDEPTEGCLSATSYDHARWYAIPADDKKNARLIISHVIVDTLQSLKMGPLKPGGQRRRELPFGSC